MESMNFNNVPSQNNHSNSSKDFLQRAAAAVNAGDKVLAIHLFMAAFERSLQEDISPSFESLQGVERAWSLAVETKQRALAEYIFERMEPLWTDEQVLKHASELQTLSLDKLEEVGVPREALEGMINFMNQDLSEIIPGLANLADLPGIDLDVKFENPAIDSGITPAFPTSFDAHRVSGPASSDQTSSNEATVAPEVPGFPNWKAPNTSGQKDGGVDETPVQKKVSENESAQMDAKAANQNEAAPSIPTISMPSGPMPQIIIPAKKHRQAKQEPKPARPRFNYSSISGFDSAIEDMKKLGVGRKNDKEFNEFIKSLNFRHGLPGMPGLGTLIFSCPSREDANYFMVATVGEMEVPAVRLRLDQNAQGQTILCVMSSPDFKQKLNTIAQASFTSPCTVILEDLDLWDFPEPEFHSDNELFNLAQMQLTRGAREALALVKAALESPEVTVFISAQHVEEIDPFFMSLMNSFRVVEMDLPDAKERRKAWRSAQSEHPSMRGLDVNELVTFSKGMSRFEIFAISHELVEDAYRTSMMKNTFVAVGTDDALTRLSNFLPLDSAEYKEVEDQVVADFRLALDKLEPEDFLD
ncbi:MAG: hypothetical protein ACI4BI_05615 [Anaerotardibacter sp.]